MSVVMCRHRDLGAVLAKIGVICLHPFSARRERNRKANETNKKPPNVPMKNDDQVAILMDNYDISQRTFAQTIYDKVRKSFHVVFRAALVWTVEKVIRQNKHDRISKIRIHTLLEQHK